MLALVALEFDLRSANQWAALTRDHGPVIGKALKWQTGHHRDVKAVPGGRLSVMGGIN